MYDRNILIVDDSTRVKTLYIPQYEQISKHIKESSEEYGQYELNFYSQETIDSAINCLKQGLMVDVLVIDYKFNNSLDGKNGTYLVDYVRKNINKHCRVLFYTMHEVESIPHADIVSLINNQIYKFIDKGKTSNEEFVKIVFEAAISCDIIVTALERFWEQYKDILINSKYTFMNNDYDFDEVINHIRMDDEIGKVIIDKLLHKALIELIEY